MPDSARETALKALLALLQDIAWTHAPAPTVERNEVETRSIPAGGLVSLRDGSPGDPEVFLSPPAYAYSHEAEVFVQFQAPTAATRDACVDALAMDIDAAVAADPTLGGVVERASVGTPEPLEEPVEGGASVKAMRIPVILDYMAATPLG